ncbi:MAG: isoprenylcysteine carboxylmethyltransferase family protein [Candidatus Omnitrophica bacterium]|nr:isoprenylcysteine carboxylmethyltransferase family protein [Candidatus Omnitrophota bacterium]
MISQYKAELIFKDIWGFLLIVAIIAQIRFRGKHKQSGGLIARLQVVAPYLVVFGWFSVRVYFGTYKANVIAQLLGLAIMLIGVSGYIAAILYLKQNWAISAAIKEGHSLVKAGPYKMVRHPMYFFMILVVLGSGLLISNYFIILYTPIVTFLYYLRSKKEEEMLKVALPEYEEYIKDTKMLIPFIF